MGDTGCRIYGGQFPSPLRRAVTCPERSRSRWKRIARSIWFLEHTGEPPYGGDGVHNAPDDRTVRPDSAGERPRTRGRANRAVFDRRVGFLRNRQRFSCSRQSMPVGWWTSRSIRSLAAATPPGSKWDRYAALLGRLPAVLLSKLRDFEIHGGDEAAGGNSAVRHILIHTVAGTARPPQWFSGGGLDARRRACLVGRRPQGDPRLAGGAAETTARSCPSTRATIPGARIFAESFGPWFALRYLPDRLTVEERWAIATTMPNRLAYFDEQGFDMSPYTVRGSALRVHGMSPFQP